MRLRPLTALMLVTLAGCYVYGPAAAPTRPGAQVEIFLSDQGRAALGRAVGAGTRSVFGELVEAADTSLTIAVERTRTIDGAEYEWNGEQLPIPASSFDSLRVRRVSVVRSAAVAGAVVGVALLVRAGLGAVSNGGGNRTPAPSPQ